MTPSSHSHTAAEGRGPDACPTCGRSDALEELPTAGVPGETVTECGACGALTSRDESAAGRRGPGIDCAP